MEPLAPEDAVIFRYTAMIRTLPSYTFHLNADGTGTYAGTLLGPDGSVQETKNPLLVSARTREAIFAAAKAVQSGGFKCEAKIKGIADTGVKVLTYGSGGCTYNYSPDRSVQGLTEKFQAMAATLEEGRRLAFKHRYDRLGLNDEMTVLWDEVKAGQAIEVGDISGVLQSLVDDGDVLERVRVRAAELLKMAAESAN